MFDEDIWWEQIHGARQFRWDLQDQLLSRGKGVWLTGEVPWTQTLYCQVKDYLSEMDSQLHITFRSAEELRGMSPDNLIFGLNPEARSRYMPGKSLAEYIRGNQLLETHIIWIYDLDQQKDRVWPAFSSELAKLKTGLRVVCQGNMGTKRYQNVKMLSTKDYFTSFDRILFAMQLAAKSNTSADLQMYYSYLAVGIAGENLEYIPQLLQSPRRMVLDPGGLAEELGIPAPDLNRVIHRVQVKVLQPKLEDRREVLVDELSDGLTKLLPFKDEYGKEFRDLYSIELRNIYHFRNQGQLKMTPQQSDRLQQLYELRNDVAHRRLVPGEEVIALLS